jgi:hypothetical protein
MAHKVKLRGVKWQVRPTNLTWEPTGEKVDGLVATYAGRAGAAAGATFLFGQRAQVAEQRATGSQMSFAMRALSNGRTDCALWMSTVGTTFGLTQDAGYFRSYMSDVEKQLRRLDPGLRLSKS